ncbi:TonB-dependent receptor [Pedobacter gandavensis]|uniref:TonB-dependent receptor n=1 Tax=Pedobacter gandavensis TaxID=2679963 RepID=UPI00247966D5|nr:TonB-dependent receptor [Pedobacter gandavensis]WGQ09295.1 TonB-dependent receptor [Pedobacter gandavensis]
MKVMLYALIKKYFNKITPSFLLLTAVLLTALMQPVLGNTHTQQVLNNKISIKLSDVELQKAFLALEDKVECVINYNPAIFKSVKRISIDVKDVSFTQVLKKMLEGTGVTYKIADAKTILLYKIPDPVKTGQLTGKILDEKGEALPGAGVKIIELNRSVSTAVDGSFTISLEPGIYTVEVSYVSYQGRRITDVVIKSGTVTPLTISMKPSSATLAGVVITGGYKKSSTDGLLARQRNAAEISNGISAEQIGRTPDSNLGEAIKRISGISTIDNKYVVVRGMGERYNAATLDGSVLPSTEVGRKAFAFDLIPSNLIDNVVVSKTITPDMNTSFAGGLVQINTKDIPDQNFSSFSIGTGVNDQSIGKDFYSPKRGKYDFLGFDDGRRDFPKDLKYTPALASNRPDLQRAEDKFAQSRLFTNDNLTLYKTPAAMAQNYQFTIGRVNNTDSSSIFGVLGSLSYRNTQNISEISELRRGTYHPGFNNYGNDYNFNTSLGGLLNAGLKLKNHRISLRNTYTRKFESITRIMNNYLDNIGSEEIGLMPPNQRITVLPSFLDLLQNKLSFQHQLGKVKLDWDVARTGIKRNEKDVIRRDLYPRMINGEYVLVNATNSTQTGEFPNSRSHYLNKETDFNWNISGSLPFTLGNTRNILKTGYSGIKKHLKLNWEGAQLNDIYQSTPDSLLYLPISEKIKPENLNPKGFVWEVHPFLIDFYEGKSQQHAGYAMFDNRFSEQWRLVWGLRAEYYKYKELKNPTNSSGGVEEIKDLKDKTWRWLPSANLTYSPLQDLNLRVAYSRTAIRPEFLERAKFMMYNPDLDAPVYSKGLTSTVVDALDFKAELFPALGEILSVGAFYRYFDKPVELTRQPSQDARYDYVLTNAVWAKNYGLELELRKRLDFIASKTWLTNMSIYGNATFIHSEVQTSSQSKSTEPFVLSRNKRPLYGQAPYLFNAGVQYDGKHFGTNVVFNRSGRKMYIVSNRMPDSEYQRPYSQLDAQLSYRFLQPRIEIKLNAGNLLNNAVEYYNNRMSYRQATPEDGIAITDVDQFILKPGYTDDFEKDDMKTFRQKIGRTYSLQLTYNF